MAEARILPCPTCGARVEWGPQSPYRPFCSERCKLIDLGAWAAEKYRVPVAEENDEPGNADAGDGKPAAR
jgi:endogenous inhibitor of DNA gyrase (YacG/DUF329 family)